MEDLTYVICVSPGPQETSALILVRSIRKFGGSLAQYPIWVLTPQSVGGLSDATRENLTADNVRLVSIRIHKEALGFPFATKVYALAHAEALAERESELIVCMDTDTIVLREPVEFRLPQGKSLGYRPVHHKLLGSDYDHPIDEFWSMVYHHCGVVVDNIFPMRTHVGDDKIRPYFNAGMLVVRPAKQLLRLWRNNFDRSYQDPIYEAFYQRHVLYRIFMHQAILTGSILSALAQTEMQKLSERINYPLHLIDEDTSSHRPLSINELVTCRYETFFQDPNWDHRVAATDTLKNWIMEQFGNRGDTQS